MNSPSLDTLKMVALISAALIALWGMFVMGWCAMWRIYVDVPMLLVLSNVVTGIASSITTILVGRTIAQLNQPGDSETTMTQTTQTVVKPKQSPETVQPIEITNSTPIPVTTESQPEGTK